VPREDRMSGAADVQGGTSAAGGHDCRDAGGRAPKVGAFRRRRRQLPRMSGAADVQGGTSAAGGQDVRSGRCTRRYKCRNDESIRSSLIIGVDSGGTVIYVRQSAVIKCPS
jgi:hypothetical protein